MAPIQRPHAASLNLMNYYVSIPASSQSIPPGQGWGSSSAVEYLSSQHKGLSSALSSPEWGAEGRQDPCLHDFCSKSADLSYSVSSDTHFRESRMHLHSKLSSLSVQGKNTKWFSVCLVYKDRRDSHHAFHISLQNSPTFYQFFGFIFLLWW